MCEQPGWHGRMPATRLSANPKAIFREDYGGVHGTVFKSSGRSVGCAEQVSIGSLTRALPPQSCSSL